MNTDEADRISRVVFQYGARIWREKDKGAQLTTIAGMTRDLVGADRCSIWLKDESSAELYTRVADGLGEIRVPAGHGLVGNCVASGEASIVNNADLDARFSNIVDKSSGYTTRSILTVPLRGASGEVIGACQVLNKPGGFLPTDVDLVGLAASFSADAIENLELQRVREAARRMQLELEIARDVQQNLFPRGTPHHQGVECAGACRPALQVGGDYYNFWSLDTGKFAIALGDVSGKGIAAALLMASIQASLHGLLGHGRTECAAIITDLSQFVLETSSAERYSTLFFAEYDPHARTLTYVNAGQTAPFLHGTAGARLTVGGPPIGLLPDSRYSQETVPFYAGDTLICFSDGISESMNANRDEWGEASIIAEAQGASALSASGLTQHLIQMAERFAGGAPQHDDMTVLVLRATA